MNKTTIVRSIGFAIAASFTLNLYADDEVVIVTANKFEQNINDTLTDVEVIDRTDIERIQPQSFIDLLSNIAGLDTVQKGGQGQDTSIFSRGSNSNQMLILIDGVRVGSATLGTKSVANIAVSQIERIEIDSKFHDDFKELVKYVVEASEAIVRSARAFFKNTGAVSDHMHKVSFWETEADKVSTRLQKKIFRQEDMRLSHRMQLRDFVRHVDKIADRSEDVADKLSIFVIKRSL